MRRACMCSQTTWLRSGRPGKKKTRPTGRVMCTGDQVPDDSTAARPIKLIQADTSRRSNDLILF
jgi:hypothetical protein